MAQGSFKSFFKRFYLRRSLNIILQTTEKNLVQKKELKTLASQESKVSTAKSQGPLTPRTRGHPGREQWCFGDSGEAGGRGRSACGWEAEVEAALA